LGAIKFALVVRWWCKFIFDTSYAAHHDAPILNTPDTLRIEDSPARVYAKRQMREQLPLRPAEFVKIRDGFIAFLRQPAGTSLQTVISDTVRDAMASAARRGRKRRIGLHFAQLASVVIALLAVVLIAAQDRIAYGGGLVLLFAAGGTFIWARKRAKARDEPEIEEILTEPDETLARNLRALDDFRKQIASGDIPCVERLPDGNLKPVTKSALRAFLADHGTLLIVSRDQNLWQCIPHRPIPMSELLVKLGGRVAPALVTSRTLLDTADSDLFDRRMTWLLAHSEADPRANSFREAIQIIIALRRPELAGLTFERKKEILRKERISDSRVEKIHAGVYPAFNNYLRQLPMHEFP